MFDQTAPGHWSRARRRGAIAASMMAAVVLAAATASATEPVKPRPTTTVMTYNVYLGANLQPLFGEDNPFELIDKADDVFDHLDQVDFGVRAVAIAKQIIEQDPDVVALQEVALWQTFPSWDPGQLTTRYDFLVILLDELERQGHPFRAVSVNPNFTGQLPIDLFGTIGRLTDRNVIIVPADVPISELTTSNPMEADYERALQVPVLGTHIEVRRGWASIDVTIDGSPYRLFDTHFEAFDAEVREDQVNELTQIMAGSPYPTVLAGDINLFPRGVRDIDKRAWELLKDEGFRDAWAVAECFEPRFTAGQTDDLDNVPSKLDNTVDYVLFDKDFDTQPVESSCDIAGEELDDRTESDPALWPSDHAGVVVDVRIAKA